MGPTHDWEPFSSVWSLDPVGDGLDLCLQISYFQICYFLLLFFVKWQYLLPGAQLIDSF